jgi:hypothetical protein
MVKHKKVIIITDMYKRDSKYRIIIVLVIAVCFSISTLNCFAITESISNPYKTKTDIKPGSIVSLDIYQQNEVVAANTTNEQRLVGVTVSNQQSLLAVNNASNTTQVVSYGISDTLVSTINGPISIGSQIAVSPLSGIGDNASVGSKIIGIAEAPFNSSTPGAISQNIYDSSKHLHKIYVGYTPVLISINGNISTTSNGGFIDSLRNLVSDIAGHTISNTSLVLICTITFITLVTIIVLIYGAITGGLISIGRNPLARGSILVSIGQIFLMVLIIAAISITIIYFILH